MKKIIALFLVLTFVVAFAASCGNNTPPTPDLTNTPSTATTTGGSSATTTEGGDSTGTTTSPAQTTTEPTLDKYKEIQDGDFVYRIMRDENGAFSYVVIKKYCSEDESLVVPAVYTYQGKALSITEIGVLGNIGASSKGLSGVKEIAIAGSVKVINRTAFFSAINAEKVVFAEGLETIGDMAFWLCAKLKDFTLPSTLKEIGENAFAGCESIETLVIPSSVETIGDGAFSGCTSLKSVTIPEKFRAQQESIFAGCTNLEITYVG